MVIHAKIFPGSDKDDVILLQSDYLSQTIIGQFRLCSTAEHQAKQEQTNLEESNS